MEPISVGDLVLRRGLPGEEDRVGTVTDLYHGVPSGVGKGVEFVAVKWRDTGREERGYVRCSGSLTRVQK